MKVSETAQAEWGVNSNLPTRTKASYVSNQLYVLAVSVIIKAKQWEDTYAITIQTTFFLMA